MKNLRMLFRLHRLCNDFTEGSDLGGGGGASTDTATTADTSTTETASTETATTADTGGPKTMLEAMESALQPDSKPAEPAAPVAAADKAVDPNKKPEQPAGEKKPGDQKVTEDDLKMPEGLKKESQERFQKLANGIRERDEQLRNNEARTEQILAVVEPFRQTLQENGVSQEQFTLASSVIGKMNRGDFRGALADLDEQRRLIALQLGESLPGVDALSDFPDLKQAVDQFQITEARALEIARSRNNEQQRTQHAQRQEQQRETKQRDETEFRAGQKSVDDFCKQMQSTDLDYAKIEPILLEQVQNGLLTGIHPSRFAQVVQSAYKMIKASAGAAKTAPSGSPALRPTGAASPGAKPGNMYDAMWGGAT